MQNKNSKIIFFFSFLLTFCLLLVNNVNAATSSLFLSPSSGQYNIGSEFYVDISVSSPDQAINAASGVISFSADKLQVVSISKENSIFAFWVQEPTFSNTSGSIGFEGVSLNPGFTGSAGKIISLKLKVTAAGPASVNLSSGTLLANDGNGSNILKSLGSAQFNAGSFAIITPDVITPPVVTPTPPVVNSKLPLAPVIYSPTHPDSNKWYKENDAMFKWTLPADITSVRLLFGKIPDSVPTIVYTPAISEKELKNLDNGVWYFHAQFKNNSGWGPVSHLKFQIDNKFGEVVTASSTVVNKSVVFQPALDKNKASNTAVIVVSGVDGGSGNSAQFDNKSIWIIILILIIGLIIFFGQQYYLFLFKKRVKKEVREAETVLDENMNIMEADLKEQEKVLETVDIKEQKPKEEQEIKVIKRDLKTARKRIKKEISDVEKEIK